MQVACIRFYTFHSKRPIHPLSGAGVTLSLSRRRSRAWAMTLSYQVGIAIPLPEFFALPRILRSIDQWRCGGCGFRH